MSKFLYPYSNRTEGDVVRIIIDELPLEKREKYTYTLFDSISANR
jgi:hypothetical protein